jgi:hypothetical protein
MGLSSFNELCVQDYEKNPERAPGLDNLQLAGLSSRHSHQVRSKPEDRSLPALELTCPDSKERSLQPQRDLLSKSRIVRSPDDLKVFYRSQDDSLSCSAYAMAMLYSDQLLGRPVSYGREAHSFKAQAGTLKHGYRGDLQSIADKLESMGLESRAYRYAKVGSQAMSDLSSELDKGHTAIARVINPHTRHSHYIYVAGRDESGNYVIGDPDSHNKSHFNPVPPSQMLKMMSGRDGFVSGWAKTGNQAGLADGSVTNRRMRPY